MPQPPCAKLRFGQRRSPARRRPAHAARSATDQSEERARELAATFNAALYGDLEPLTRAVPGADLQE
ncbi:hypothetical protein [Streptomyces sp. NPDC001165]|uniref:hypothetical protein n=1 Tax=Streptomyces sp. NPDC001165 TaxID=3364546 RepID=UPI0036CBE94A